MNIRLMTDGNGDLPKWYTDQRNITVMPMTYRIDDREYRDVQDTTDLGYLDPHAFYDMLRAGKSATTAQINTQDFLEVFRPVLAAGDDIFFVCFSSGLSGTHGSLLTAIDMLKSEFPARTIYAVDSLGAAGGQALLTHIAAQKLDQGMPPEELEQWLNREKLMLHHWFTVDDLGHLRRGGRISAATAVMGSMLGIKPVLNVNSEGKLISIDKAKGRKRAIKALVDRMEQYCDAPGAYDIFISHADCLEDAETLAAQVKERFGVEVKFICSLSSTVGSHAGPGTLALFFMGNQLRE